MNERQFKDAFIASFVASWCANNYEDYCMRGLHDELRNPPMEDAIDLSQTAWEKYQEFEKDI